MGREIQPRNRYFPSAERFPILEGSSAVRDMASGRPLGGVSVRGTHEEGGPVTWEIPALWQATPRRTRVEE